MPVNLFTNVIANVIQYLIDKTQILLFTTQLVKT